MQIAPDWLRKPTWPGRAMVPAKVALRPVRGFISPRQLGPTSRMPERRRPSRMRASRAMPAAPISRKPAESTITPLTPAAAQASINPGTVAAGVAITARSTASGTSATVA